MNRIVDDQIVLIPYYRNDEISLLWYQDSEVCKQVDNTEQIYDLIKLHKMYDYLTSHGSCYYIQYEGVLVGDVTLQDNCMVVRFTVSAYAESSKPMIE